MVNKRGILVLLVLVLLTSFVNAIEVLPIYARPKTAIGELQPNTLFSYVFNFTTDSACTDVKLSQSANITTDAYGIGFVELDVIGISKEVLYLCEYRNSALRKVHNISLGLFQNMKVSGNLTVQESYLEMYNNTVTVAKRGGDFTSIQAAIDNITGATANNKYLVLIYPGVYNENLVGKNHVCLRGIGTRGSAVINGSNGGLYSFPAQGGGLTNLKFIGRPITDNRIILNSSAGNHRIRNLAIEMISSTNGITGQLIHLTGGTLHLEDSSLVYNLDGNTTGVKNHEIINITGTSIFEMHRSEAEIEVSDWDDNVTFIQDAATSGTHTHLMDNLIHVDMDDPSYSGTAYGIKSTGSNIDRDLKGNLIHLSQGNDSGLAYAYHIDSTDNTAEFHSSSNFIQVINFSNSHYAYIGTGDTLISHFDDVMTVNTTNHTMNYGTFIYTYSPANGYFYINEDMHASYVEFDDPSNTYIGRDKTFPDYFAFANDYTNFWLGYSGDRNIWMNYAVKADLYLGSGGDTDVRIYNNTKYTTLDQSGDDFYINVQNNGIMYVDENVNLSKNLYVDGCIRYNCSQATGCVTLGTCV